jgi:hypothetical protein
MDFLNKKTRIYKAQKEERNTKIFFKHFRKIEAVLTTRKEVTKR